MRCPRSDSVEHNTLRFNIVCEYAIFNFLENFTHHIGVEVRSYVVEPFLVRYGL